MGDEIGLGLLSMAVCFDFRSTNIVQLSNTYTSFNVIKIQLMNNLYIGKNKQM